MKTDILPVSPVSERPTSEAQRRTLRSARTSVTVLMAAIATINLFAAMFGETPLPATHLVASAMAGYLMLEARLLLRRADALCLLSPALLAVLFHFALSYLAGITFAAFNPEVMTRYAYWLPNLDTALAGTLIVAVLAAFCMLRGYALARPAARRLRNALERTPSLRREFRPNFTIVIAMQALYVGLVVYAINLGTYGLLGTPESVEIQSDVVQLLNVGLAAGTLSYFFILLRFFQRRACGRASFIEGWAVAALIAMHAFLGILAAFKSQVVLPFVIAGFAYFLATRRFPVGFIAMAFAALAVSYAVVEPFRAYVALRGQPPSSVVEAFDALDTAISLRAQFAGQIENSRLAQVTERLNLAGMSALAIDYVERGNLMDRQRQEFLDSILLAPILAYIPRAVWSDKPSYSSVGKWFNQEVRGRWSDERTSVGMGPIGYLYMAGGMVAVLVGFLGFGVLQALIFEGVARAGMGGLIVYVGVAGTLVLIPSAFGPALTGLLRMLPFVFLAQLVLLRPGACSDPS